jgi:hypothetical protein
MYDQYFQNMPDDELVKAITAFLEYVTKYESRQDSGGAVRMQKLVAMARNEQKRRQK